MTRMTPCLWLDGRAEEAAEFYTSIFPNSSIGTTAHYGEAAAQVSGQPAGSVMTVAFELDGQPYLALNGGPLFKFTPALSLIVNCDTQGEVDHYWEKLSHGGEKSQCGWLTDQFGVSWQVAPRIVEQYMADPAKAEKAMASILTMTKLDIAEIKRAVEGA